jgi:hypothetical protein
MLDRPGVVSHKKHPLIVPRLREYLEHQFKLDEATRIHDRRLRPCAPAETAGCAGELI